MIYTAIDTFYLTDEQLKNSPSRKDGIGEATETSLRIYGCDLIQESGILLKLPQAVMATGQVLFHRFYCKKSFARFGVKRVAASCVWLASKLEENRRRAKHVIIVFHRMECRRENLPIEHFDVLSKKYIDLKNDLVRTERHLLKEMGFICHAEHPHKFISNYLATLGAPPELRQEAWNLANDSLRTTLCIRFKSEVVACGVIYAAARRFQVPLPENPPWWVAFDADQSGIEEVCRVLAHLYSLPKAQYVSVCKENDSFALIAKMPDTHVPKESLQNGMANDGVASKVAADLDASLSKDMRMQVTLDRLESKKSDDDIRSMPSHGEVKDDMAVKSKGIHRTDVDSEKSRDRERDRSKTRDHDRGREHDKDREIKDYDRDRQRDYDRDREWEKMERDNKKHRERRHYEKTRHHSSRDHGEYHTSHSSRDKDRYRHHPYS